MCYGFRPSRQSCFCFGSVVALLITLVATVPAEVVLTTNQDGNLVFTGQGESVSAIEVRSPLGGLIPVGTEGKSESAAPFQFFLTNNEKSITWANLGVTYELDGELVTRAALNPDVEPVGIEALWGDGPHTREAEVQIEGWRPVGDLHISLDADQKLVLSGEDVFVHQLWINGNGIIPSPNADSEVPDRFGFLYGSNSETSQQIGSADLPLEVNGSVTLEIGIDVERASDLRFMWSSSVPHKEPVLSDELLALSSLRSPVIAEDQIGSVPTSTNGLIPEPSGTSLVLIASLVCLLGRQRRVRSRR